MEILNRSESRWLSRPAVWSLDETALTIQTDDRTDFWQETHYGFHRDDGHALLVPARGDFTATVVFEGQYEHLYDQAGVLLRVDEAHWIKLGVEYSDDVTNFSCVVTRQTSDWSVVSRPALSGPQSVRLTRKGTAVFAHHRLPDGAWQMMRLCDFPAPEHVWIGPMACSPQRQGFRARFTEFRIDPALERPLH